MLNRPSKAVVTRVIGIVGALVALSAFLMLSNMPGLVFAQATGIIMYAENGDSPVRTFTSEDPEGMGIYWDVTGTDAGDFSISGGVLEFNNPPNFEIPTDRPHGTLDFNEDGDIDDMGEAARDSETGDTRSTNTYQVTIRASEMRADSYMGRALSTETHVTVMVTDRNEPGTAKLNRRQPEVGTTIMASLDDPDGERGSDGNGEVVWMWSVSTVTNPVDDAPNHWAPVTGIVNTGSGEASLMSTYIPRGDCADGLRGPDNDEGCPVVSDPNRVVDENRKLRAVATYNDLLGTGREAIVVSEFPVRAEVSSDLDRLENPANGSPGFAPNLDYTRTVSESLGKGMNVGAEVVAADPNNDTLTYELMAADAPDAADVGYFSINMSTGQLKVKNTLDWDDNPMGGPADGKYKFMVVAIDPSGETAEVEVTVVAKDANDTPVIMGSRSSTLAPDAPTPDPASEIRVMEQDSDDRTAPTGPDATYYGTSDGMMGTAGSAMGLPATLALGNQNVFTVSDEDERGQRFWDLRGDDADDFTLTQGGTTSTGTQGSLSGPNEPIGLVFTNPPDFEMPTDANGDSVYKIILVARDSAGAESTRAITIFVDNVPEQGKATLSVEQPYIGTKIMADVEDPDGGEAVVTWQWSKSSSNAPVDTFTVIHGATASSYTPDDDDDGFYLRVTATYIDTTSNMDDPETGTRDERVQKGATGLTALTDAQTAHDGDGVTDADGGTPGETPDKVFRVMVTSAFAVRVEPGPPGQVMDPEFFATSYERMVMENAEVGTLVGEPVRAESEKDVTFKYDLDATETNDNNYFTINENYGQIRVGEVDFPSVIPATIIGPDANAVPEETEPDMEDPALNFEGTNTFVLIVTATDTEDENRTANARVTIRLNDLNERPYFDKESRDAVAETKMYAESRTNIIVPLAAMEPDGDSIRWEVTGVDAVDFKIRDVPDIAGDGKDRVELHFKNQPNFEGPTDRGLNLNPGTGDGLDLDFMDPGEYAPQDNTYQVTVRATETTAVGGGPNMATELAVTVQVTNSDESGTVELNWLQPEVGTAITATLTDLDGEIGTDPTWTWYRAKNKNPNRNPSTDDTNAAFMAEWELITDLTVGSPTNPNPLDVEDVGQDSPTYVPQGDDTSVDNADNAGDVAADEGWHLLARVTYTDPQSEEGDDPKAAVGISAYPVQADVSDEDNNSPDFNQDTTTRTVPENRGVGMTVGDAVDVDRNEDGDRLTYQLDNDKDATTPLDAPATGVNRRGNADTGMPGDVGYFSINPATGQLSVAKKLDWDNNPAHPRDPDGKYEFWVRATDPSGETNLGEDHDYIKVTVTATDVNDAPRVVDGRDEISLKEVNSTAKDDDGTRFIGLGYRLNTDGDDQEADPTNPNLYHRADEDRVDRGIWPEPLAGPDGSLFEYKVPDDGIGRRLLFKKINLPDYENPMDANRDNVYEVTIVLRDNGNAQGTKNVRITVMNVDEMGKLELTPAEPDRGMPVMATLKDPDGVEYITDWKWYETDARIDDFPTTDADNDGMIDGLVMWATTDKHTGKVGDFVWAMVDYRDGYSMEDDPITALDERNNNPTDTAVEQHKFQDLTDADDTLFWNSDQVVSKGTDNAVQKAPDDDDDVKLPSTSPVLVSRMVYENVPSTGYTGIPLKMDGEMGLRYKDANGDTQVRDTIGGPDGATFVFAEGPPFVTTAGATNYDDEDADFYDMELTNSDNLASDADEDPNDKMGQLAANVVTHFDADEDKTEYIIEVTDPDAEVAVGPVRVTITVMNVNEAPTAPMEQRGGLSVTGRENPMFNEILADDTSPDLMVGTYRGIGVDAANAVWSLTGPDMGDFSIGGSTGEVTFRAAPNYEMPMDADTDNRYQITVVANDGTNGATLPVTVMVVNVDEDGTLTLWASATEALTMAPQVGDTITGAVMDPDGGVTGESWQWARTTTPAMMDSWMDIAGKTNAAYTVTEGDTGYYLRVMATYTDAVGTDMDMADSMPTMMVGAEAGDPLFGYDTSGNGRIDKAELANAVLDYEINLTLEKPALAKLVLSYEIG